MKIYRDDRKEKISAVICNKCGKRMLVANGTVMEGVCSVEADWGYFSGKDGEHHSFDLCEACYDEVVKSFQIPADVQECVELI